ncbi:MAG: hypothetical protein MUF24_08320 [Chitinophagaceae bacterium]|jgi:hypothetical protein|nr:hypothetical protein [Chitinophagaceae bacterium]
MLTLLPFFSCKKIVDQAQQNALYDLITNGRWELTRFNDAGTDRMAEYAGYQFQFFRNNTVSAYKTGQPDVSGNWTSNLQNLSFTADFSNAGLPLSRFTTGWVITRSTLTTVEAISTDIGKDYQITLRKL